MNLYIGKNHLGDASPVQSIFRLVGSDEDALTFALGFLLAQSHSFCTELVRHLRIAPRLTLKSTYSIHLQEVTGPGFGRRDIVIEDDNTRIVLEAKIGGAEPTAKQLLQYGAEHKLWNQFNVRGVVALTQVALATGTRQEVQAKLGEWGIRFSNVQWHEVVDLVLSYKLSDESEVSRYLFDQFIRYIGRDYRMGYYDAEILIQDVNPLNARIFEECWMYVTSLKDKRAPLYFAPYFTGRGADSGISAVSRVRDTEVAILSDKEDVVGDPPSDEHLDRWRAGLAKLRKRAEEENFAHRKTRLLYLDRPVTRWSSPMSKKAFNETGPSKQIPRQIPKGFSLRFDQLLLPNSGE